PPPIPAAARSLTRPRGPHRVDPVAAVCDRHGVLVPAAATETLIVGSHDDVAFLDEGLDAGQAVVGPGITTHQEILVQRLGWIEHLRWAAVLRRAGGAVRPCDH